MFNLSKLLINIKNASAANINSAVVPYTKLNLQVSNFLYKKGFIKNYFILNQKNFNKKINIVIKYKGWWSKTPFICDLKQISKSSLRAYTPYSRIYETLLKYNAENYIAIMSTSKGLLDDKEAITHKTGGEILFVIKTI